LVPGTDHAGACYWCQTNSIKLLLGFAMLPHKFLHYGSVQGSRPQAVVRIRLRPPARPVTLVAMSNPVGQTRFVDGTCRDVFRDSQGQYVHDDNGTRVDGVWLLEDEADAAIVVDADGKVRDAGELLAAHQHSMKNRVEGTGQRPLRLLLLPGPLPAGGYLRVVRLGHRRGAGQRRHGSLSFLRDRRCDWVRVRVLHHAGLPPAHARALVPEEATDAN